MASNPVTPWMPKPPASDCWAMLVMIIVPVVSHARPPQNRSTWRKDNVPERRSPNTPTVYNTSAHVMATLATINSTLIMSPSL